MNYPERVMLNRYDTSMKNRIARMRQSMDYPRYRTNYSSLNPYGYLPEEEVRRDMLE